MSTIIGSGGGKSGGGGGGLSESPDTLSSVAFARFVDLIGEGEIDGLVNGEHSIYLDGIALKDFEGTAQFKPFTSQSTKGTQIQLPIPGFSGTVQESAVSLELNQITGKVVRSIPDADADSVKVTIAVSGFSKTSDKGQLGPAEVEYKVSVRVVGGSYVVGFQGKLEGKTTSRYQRSHEINLKTLGPGPYEVAVERVSADTASALIVDTLYWDSYAVINYEPFSYPNSALVAIEVDGRYFSTVPTRGYHVRGLLVRVPTNYDPVTRVYTGVWDGTFKIAYTNNPAWCFFDLVTNSRYGLGKRIRDAQISKWVVYQIGKYCDELVPTGITGNVFSSKPNPNVSPSGTVTAGVPVRSGALEPRFTLNVVINTKKEAYKVLNDLCSVFRGMPYWASGMVTLTQDRPTVPSIIWTNANVVEGVFTYEGSARADRHTTVTVGWNDPSEDFRQRYEYVEDREGMLRYGIRPMEMMAFGCTSRSEARRVGLWLLYTERIEKDAIKFRVGHDSAYVMPGDVGKIMDVNRTGARWGGRIVAATTSLITVDAPVTLAVGSYTISIMSQDGTIVEKAVNITTPGPYTELALAIPFGTAPSVMAIWALSSTTVVPMLGRVISVTQSGSSEYDILCLEHNPDKYAAIELGAAFIEADYSFLSYGTVPAVTNLTVVENSFKTSVSSVVQTNVEIGWDLLNDPLVRGYRLKVSAANGSVIDYPEQRDPYRTLLGITPDTLTVSVSAVNHLGIVGPLTTVVLVVLGIDLTPPSNVAGFVSEVQRDGVKFSWTPNLAVDYLETELHLESVWNDATPPFFVGRASTYTAPEVPAGAYDVVAKHRDTSGNMSLVASHVNDTVPVYVPPADGADGINALLTNEAHTLPATNPGVVTSFAGADTFMRVFSGVVEDTSNWTFTKADENVCSHIVDNHVTVHAWGEGCVTKLLIHADEAAGVLVPVDSSDYAHTIVNTGTDVQVVAGNAAYGNSLNFPGTGAGVLTIADKTEFVLTNEDFAFQFQYFLPELPTSEGMLCGLWGTGTDFSQQSYRVVINTSGAICFDYVLVGATASVRAVGPVLAVGALNKVGISRVADVLTLTVITP